MRFGVIILLFLAFSLRGQGDQVILGEPYSSARAENFSGFIGEAKTAVFTLDYIYVSRNKQELTVRKFYKSDLKEIESVNIYSNPYDDYSSDPQELFFQNNHFYLFSILRGEKDNSDLIRLEIFNDDLQGEKDFILDTLIAGETVKVVEEVEENGFIVCSYDKLAKIKDRKINLIAVGPLGTEINKETVKSAVALQSFVVEEIVYKKNQPIYLLCNYSLSNNNVVSEDQERLINNKYSLWAFDPGINFLKEFELRFSIKWVNGISMKLNQQNELIISGFINETRNKSINGLFSVLLNNQLEVIETYSNKLDEATINDYLPEREKGKIKEIEDLEFREMLLLEDDSYFLLGEEYAKYTERNYDPRTNITTTTDHFYYHSILVAYFNKNGKNEWIKRIPKEQNTTNDYGYFSSFAAFVSGKSVRIFFNDNEKNANVANENTPTIEDLNENRKFIIAGLTITPDSVGRRTLITSKDNLFILRAKKSNQISSEMIYLQTERSRSARLIGIRLEEN